MRKVHPALKPAYSASAEKAVLVEVPTIQYLMIDGQGAPGSPAFQEAVEVLTAMANAIHSDRRRRTRHVPSVMPLEALWCAPGTRDPSLESFLSDRAHWVWTLMIAQPEVSGAMVEHARRRVAEKHPQLPVHRVRLGELAEGPCAQLLHEGPWHHERRSVERLHEFIAASEMEPGGMHHEIYLNDPGRVPAEEVRTILRQPVRAKRGLTAPGAAHSVRL